MRRLGRAANARERVRQRLKALLDQHGIDQRTFGKRMGRKRADQYAWSILSGRASLGLDDLDEAAKVARTTPAELVKHDDDETLILGPSETRLIRSARLLPPVVCDCLITLADYLRGVAPEEIAMLEQYRELTPEEQQRWLHGLELLRLTRPGGSKT